jgi:uncharacterized protein (TIRG00374 family)
MEVEVTDNKNIVKGLNPNKIIIPITLGLLVVLVMIFTNGKLDYGAIIKHLKTANPWWIGGAILVLLARDLGYMYRIRKLSSDELSWKSSLFTVILWEFSSAITPSVVGGTAVAVFIINKEGIAFGRSLAYVMLTAGLDNMFFVLASLSVLFLIPMDIFPAESSSIPLFGYNLPLQYIFTISVILISIYTFLMLFGLLVTPRAFKWVAVKITSLPLLKRWQQDAIQNSNDMIIASDLLKGHSSIYWIEAIVSTIFIWSARYLMVNCLVAAFTHLSLFDHILIFSKQIIMWIIMLISPTPGSSGTAEYFFGLFFEEFFTVAGFSIVVALFWRLFTYYTYLIIGAIALPRWLKRVFK